MDNGTQWSLTLSRLPQGGYIVEDGFFHYDSSRMRQQHFASTSIDEALAFIRDKVLPIESRQEQEKNCDCICK